MHDPVIAAGNHSYEPKEIKKWFAGGNVKSPLTGKDTANTTLSPNFTLKKIIQGALEVKMTAAAGGAGSAGVASGGGGGGGGTAGEEEEDLGEAGPRLRRRRTGGL